MLKTVLVTNLNYNNFTIISIQGYCIFVTLYVVYCSDRTIYLRILKGGRFPCFLPPCRCFTALLISDYFIGGGQEDLSKNPQSPLVGLQISQPIIII